MADSFNKLWLKGQAEEDIYFAKRDRELIAALRKKKGDGSADSTAVEEQDPSSDASKTVTDGSQRSKKSSGS
ncbi:MAG: hypothetical protein G8D61_16885 [gamma proteobacterium symbiont of Ctena orbiculata]|nr:hypothetical protein [Candidatus Thiodiazotropha taylori]MBT3063389.1 hypothetical protein [Candidatus Thiodiazotropha sp. (ex Lucina pensylvanica)]MBV2094916.1 hypothetical protein [Candidatus Thiodiazotropha sp. (ex Codakia orbicularis)]PUB75607.1 MAG: hypothetical protein DBO99_16335 [gamma proteobacterium symbiont of Ctena orbiculata]